MDSIVKLSLENTIYNWSLSIFDQVVYLYPLGLFVIWNVAVVTIMIVEFKKIGRI